MDLNRLHSFADALKANYVAAELSPISEEASQVSVPPHVGSPKDSIFYIISESSFNSLSTPEILDILAKKCIVVTDRVGQQLQFDAKGLSTLSTLSTVVSIQGMFSLHVLKSGALIARCPRSIPWA